MNIISKILNITRELFMMHNRCPHCGSEFDGMPLSNAIICLECSGASVLDDGKRRAPTEQELDTLSASYTFQYITALVYSVGWPK